MALRAHHDEIGLALLGVLRIACPAAPAAVAVSTEQNSAACAGISERRRASVSASNAARSSSRLSLVDDSRDAQLGWHLDHVQERQVRVGLLRKRQRPGQSRKRALREINRADDVREGDDRRGARQSCGGTTITGHGASPKHVLRHRAKQQTPDAGAAVTTHDDEIRRQRRARSRMAVSMLDDSSTTALTAVRHDARPTNVRRSRAALVERTASTTADGAMAKSSKSDAPSIGSVVST